MESGPVGKLSNQKASYVFYIVKLFPDGEKERQQDELCIPRKTRKSQMLNNKAALLSLICH